MRRAFGRSLVLAAGLCASRGARAACPESGSPDRTVCEPRAATLVPTVFGAAYFAGRDDQATTWAGGGVELVLLTWATNSPSFGPSHGRIRFDVGMMRDVDGDASLVMYRGGAVVSFEKNASRRFLLPFFVADVGGTWTEATGTTGFVDGGVGLYLYYGRSVMIDLSGTWTLPFSRVDAMAGPQARSALSFALW